MRTIAVANQKGGVGKTTIAVHLAAYLSERGRKVVLVDMDPQANTTSWLLDGELDNAIWRVLVGEEPPLKALRGTKWGVALLPGDNTTGDAMLVLSVLRRPFDYIAGQLEPLKAVGDYVIIDMPPSRSAGFYETLFAADYLLVPTKLERMSLQGVVFMARTVKEIRERHRRGPVLLGIVPNLVRLQTREHLAELKALVKVFKDRVWPPMPLSTRVPEACAYGTTVFEIAPSEKITEAVEQVCQRVIENLEGGERCQSQRVPASRVSTARV